MSPRVSPPVDTRDAAAWVAWLLAHRAGFTPEWLPSADGPDAALVQIAGRYLEAVGQRLNQAPDKHRLAFLEMLGIELIPARPARVPVVFQLAADATDSRAPAGTRVAAAPPPESTRQIVFETERASGVMAARLREVVSLWPGRDQYIDHSAAHLAGQPMRPFDPQQLRDTPHHLYLAHDLLLALTGQSNVDVRFELATPGSEHLDIFWEYWDGEVWREFLDMRPECGEAEAVKLDSTGGLRRSGIVHLRADGAESKKTTVNGIEAHWVRGRLDDPLTPDPRRVLPEVENLALQTTSQSTVEAKFTCSVMALGNFTKTVAATEIHGHFIGIEDRISAALVRSENGLPDVEWVVQEASAQFGLGRVLRIRSGDLWFRVFPDGGTVESVEMTLWYARDVAEPVINSGNPSSVKMVADDDGNITLFVRIIGNSDSITIVGQDYLIDNVTVQLTKPASPDQAFSGELKIDLSKTFYPFGPLPQPGSAYYFTSADIFCKAGANVRVLITKAATPQDDTPAVTTTDPLVELVHNVVWEYWNGEQWSVLTLTSDISDDPVPDLRESDIDHTFIVPRDMAPTQVNGQDGLWARVRLAEGAFGYMQTVQLPTGSLPATMLVPVHQPPSLASFNLSYTWKSEPVPAEHVLTYNDFQYADRTEAARWPGKTFPPYATLRDITPTLYLGFDGKPPVDRLGLYVDIDEQSSDLDGPALDWEYFDGFAWQPAAGVEDGTHRLRAPGSLGFLGAEDSAAIARFGTARHWLRARLKEDGPPGEVTVNRIYTNAIWALQRETVVDEPLGTSTGQPNQVFRFRQLPILSEPLIDVREVSGARANVEWRIVARDVFRQGVRPEREVDRLIREAERQLADEGGGTDIELAGMRLRRDRQKRVTEVWVRWQQSVDLHTSAAADRHYALEAARGRATFGDGTRGRVPPVGAAVLARRYRTGGGADGNVAAGAVSQLMGSAGAVELVFNPVAAEGGANGEPIRRVAGRGARSVRTRGRALAAPDYEVMAMEAAASVAVVRAVPCRAPDGRRMAGWVTLVIIPYSDAPRPMPSFQLREQVRAYIGARAGADVAAAERIHVTGPAYIAVDVEATIAVQPTADAGDVDARARQALQQFLHPLTGGPEGSGWQPGRSVYLSDVAATLERVEGVDYAPDLALLRDGVPQGERVRVPEAHTVVAGDIRVKLAASEA